jgi:SAM-dependent methyltransferase
MTRDRDIAAFDARAGSYEGGWLGRLARAAAPGDSRSDCGTGAGGGACATAAADDNRSTTSFDHWADQQAGLAECARVLAPGGWLVLTDLFSGWLAPTLVGGRRHKARTKRSASRLLAAAGFQAVQWHDVEGVVIRTVTAARG